MLSVIGANDHRITCFVYVSCSRASSTCRTARYASGMQQIANVAIDSDLTTRRASLVQNDSTNFEYKTDLVPPPLTGLFQGSWSCRFFTAYGIGYFSWRISGFEIGITSLASACHSIWDSFKWAGLAGEEFSVCSDIGGPQWFDLCAGRGGTKFPHPSSIERFHLLIRNRSILGFLAIAVES